jgi:hypothetical protein
MSADKDLDGVLPVMEQYAEQLRASTLDFLHQAGDEFTQGIVDTINQMMESEDDPVAYAVGCLADIGFCDAFSRAGRNVATDAAAEDDESDQ